LALIVLLWSAAAGDDWPQWRGPNRDNVSNETGLLREWPTGGPQRLWTAVGLGEGIASVAIAEGRIYTVGYQGESEFVTALDERTGELVWRARIGSAVAENPLMRWLIQRVPTVDIERLYAFTAAGEVICLSTADGHELWRKSYPADFEATRPNWGFGDYPIVDGEKLVCTPGGPNAHIAALNKHTGAVLWTSTVSGAVLRTDDYSAALVAELGGAPTDRPLRQYIAFINQRLTGVAADDGRVLWRYEKVGNGTGHAHTPIVRGDHVLCTSGYGSPAALLNLVRDGQNVRVEEVWLKELKVETFQDSTLAVGDQIFVVGSGGILECVSWKSGLADWRERLGSAGRLTFTYADGCLYVRGSEGKLFLVEATPAEMLLKGSFAIPDHQPSQGATSPVVAGGRLYLRDDTRLHCYDVGLRESDAPAYFPRTIELVAGVRSPAGAGRAGERRPPRGVFVPTPHDVVKRMLELAKLAQADLLYDLGCGDGRIVTAAAKQHGCRAVGFEIDPELVALAQRSVEQAEVGKLVTIEKDDVFDVDLSRADVVTLYLLPQQNEKLIAQLKRMKPGSRIVSHQFELSGIVAAEQIEVESQESGEKHRLYLYKLPLESN
jgi:outer membrane protein assembly factor BamB/precorrin-6B methylase 2